MAAETDDAPGKTGGTDPERRAQRRRQRPPVTIDLEAEAAPPRPVETVAEGVADPLRATPPPIPPVPATPEPRPRRSGVAGLIIAGVVGGVIATGLGIVWHASGIVPSRADTAAAAAVAKAEAATAAVAGLDGRIVALEGRPAGVTAADLATVTGKLVAVETAMQAAGKRIEALEARPVVAGDGSNVSGAAFAAIESRLAALEAGGAGGDGTAALAAPLEGRVAALEAGLKTLDGKVAAMAADTGAGSEDAARAVAIGVIRQAAETGNPFAGDLAMLKALGGDDAALTAIAPLAAKGVPGRAALQAEFPAIADAILMATELADGGGFFDGLAAYGRSLVSIRPMEPVAGTTPEAVVSRMQAAVARGDLAAALGEQAALPPEGQAASAEWAAAANDRVRLDRLMAALSQPAAK